ncbi:MAG: hypothetical protein RIQ96_1216 [Pseudomonadota bacterium]|jgi:hypothetical protein
MSAVATRPNEDATSDKFEDISRKVATGRLCKLQAQKNNGPVYGALLSMLLRYQLLQLEGRYFFRIEPPHSHVT